MATLDNRTLVAVAAGVAIGAVTALAATHYLLASSATSTACNQTIKSGAISCVFRQWQRNASEQSPPPPFGSLQPHSRSSAGNAGASSNTDSPTMARFEEDEILQEQFTRNVQFFGQDGQSKVAGSFVVVIGLGGVGSHAAHLLLRSGVGRLRLVDFDQVSLSSLNRHALATRADVGLPKATVLQRHFRNILPEAEVEAHVAMYTEEAEEQLLAGNPDFVLDAIDNIDTKVALLAACKRRGIPVLCVAGAGAKADPTRLRIADVCECCVDPLARSVRKQLRKRHGIDRGIPVLMSTEKPRCKLVDMSQGQGSLLDYQVVPSFRIRSIPVLGTTPALFGIAAAAHIICELAKQPLEPAPLFRMQWFQYGLLLERLREREEGRWGTATHVLVDVDEIVVLANEVWRGVSARSSFAGEPPAEDKGLNRVTAGLTFTRWNSTRPADVDNLILLTFEEADAHEGMELDTVTAVEPNFAKYVEAGLDKARRIFGERMCDV